MPHTPTRSNDWIALPLDRKSWRARTPFDGGTYGSAPKPFPLWEWGSRAGKPRILRKEVAQGRGRIKSPLTRESCVFGSRMFLSRSVRSTRLH